MEAQSFPACERLLTPAHYKHVYARRSVAKSRCFWIYRASNGLQFCRLGISVNNKVCPHLVARNRIKRLIRETFRLNKNRFPAGTDYVVVVKTYPTTPTLNSVTREILNTVA